MECYSCEKKILGIPWGCDKCDHWFCSGGCLGRHKLHHSLYRVEAQRDDLFGRIQNAQAYLIGGEVDRAAKELESAVNLYKKELG
jgi:hypothetical protein